MFEELKQFRNIWVSGPQRSGTRILTRCIAHDTGFTYTDETAFGTADFSQARHLGDTRTHCVIQCPALFHELPRLCDSEDLAVISIRDVDDIIRSQKRIGWRWEQAEKRHLVIDDKRPVAAIKYYIWEEFMRAKIPNWREVEYESLRDHPLWVENRPNWKWNQTNDETALGTAND